MNTSNSGRLRQTESAKIPEPTYVYILKCADDKLYRGHTKNIDERLYRHVNGLVDATKDRRPLKLIWYGVFENKYVAIEFEKYLKSGSGRAFTNKHLI
jgi:putative endonuclease